MSRTLPVLPNKQRERFVRRVLRIYASDIGEREHNVEAIWQVCSNALHMYSTLELNWTIVQELTKRAYSHTLYVCTMCVNINNRKSMFNIKQFLIKITLMLAINMFTLTIIGRLTLNKMYKMAKMSYVALSTQGPNIEIIQGS